MELEFQRTREGLVSLRQGSVRQVLVHKGKKTCRAIDFTEGKLPLDMVLSNDWLGENLRGHLMGSKEESTIEAHIVRSPCFLNLEMRIPEDDLMFYLSRLPLASSWAC